MASSIARNLKPWPVLRRIPRYPTTQTTGSRLLSTETAKASPQLESSNSPTPPTKNARIKERRDWSTSMDEVKNRTIFIDIPKSMIQADVKRMLQSIDVKGIKEVQLHYSQFVRDGGAYVIFASSSERNAALHTLENYSKSRPYLLRNPRPVQHPSYRIEDEVDEKGQLKKVVMSTRRRGVEGTNEALLKGTVNGTGGNANIQDRGTSVLLSGFYRACDVERLSRDFRGKFAVRDDVEAILKVPSPNPRTSSFLVRCESSAEAHRLVRTAHHSHLRSAVKEGTPELTAKVIYYFASCLGLLPNSENFDDAEELTDALVTISWMFEFRPTRASPQLRPLRQSSTQTSLTTTTTTTDTSTSSALPTLTDADIRIIDAIIKRAPASATSFPAVFKAYNEVLQEEGLDPLQDILYYRFLLKMTVIRGNWGERWEQTKKQQRLIDAGDGDTEIEANSDAETDVCPNQKPTTPKPVLGSLTFNRPRSRTEMPSTTPRHTPSAVTRPQPRTRPSSTSDEAGDSGPPSYRTYVTEKQQPAAKETKTPRPQPKSTTKLPPSSVTRPTPRSILKQTPKPTPASIPPPKQHTPATPVPPPRTLAAFAEAAARAGKLKLAGLNTDVGDGKTSAINAEETWKVLRMEREADDFRRDFLIRKCIEVWAEGVRWIAKTNSQVDDARKDILIRDVLSKWRSIVSHRLDLQRRADNVAAVLGIRAALKKWRHVLREKRQKAWREDMKRRLGEMRKKVDSRIVNEAFWAWGHRHDEIKAQYIHSRRLLLKAIEKWRAKYSHVEQLNIVADNVMDSRDRIQQETTLALWRRKSKLNALERVMVQKRDAGIMHRAILVWINNAHMNRLAMVHQRKYILRTMLQRWRNALAYVDRLDRRVTKYVLRQDAILVRAVLRVWVAKERGGLLERVRKTRLLRSTMAVWKDRLKHTRELEDRATAYIANTNLDLMGRAFAIMRHKTKMYQNAVIVADQQYHKPLMARFFVNWKVELAMNKRRERSAKVARRFFSVQSAWKQWRLALAIKKREKIEAEVQRRWLKRWFLTWRDQARKQKEWKWLVTAFKEKVDYRIMSESLNTWISRVVDIKSNELRVSDEYDTRLMKMAVTRWKQVRARHIEEMSLMQSYHDVKRDDLARRVFLKWLGTTRKSVHRRRKLEQKEEENKHLVLVNAWQKWREKYKERELSDLEQQLIMQRNMSILFRTFRIWESKCLSVPAVRFFSLNIKTKMWNRWREALPRAQRESEAKDIWKKKVMSQVFATWKKAYEAKTSLKSIARARNLRLPTAVNSRPSYQRPSTSPFARVANTGLISRLSATPPERPARFGSASPVRNGFAGDTDNRSRRARSRSPEPKAANISGPTTKTPARTSLLSKAYARPQADVAPIIVEIDMPSKSGPTPPKSHKAPSVAGGSRGIIEDDAPPPPKRTIDHLRGHSIGRRLGDAKTDGDAMSVVRGRSERDAETDTPAGGRPSGLTRTLSIGGDNAFGASERYKLRMELRQKGLLSGVKGIGGNAAGDQTR